MIGVHSQHPGYRIATLELPMSARIAEGLDGAIVVVPGGHGWERSARCVLDAGAVAVIVADPAAVDIEGCAALEGAVGGRPVIVDRPMLRADLVETVSAQFAAQGSAPSYVAVDVAASVRRASAVREAAGWMRVLAGGTCEVQRVDRTGAAGIVLADHGGTACTLTTTTLTGADEGPWIRGIAVGGARVEVVIDEARARATVEWASQGGALRAPRRYEARERLSLRRAIHALESPERTTDLADLRLDAMLVDALKGGRS